jgi:hypothetical protein
MSRQISTKEEQLEIKRERVPLHQARDKIKTRGLDTANFHYKFVDMNDEDQVLRHLEAGFLWVEQNGTQVGERVVDTSTGVSSLVTIPGGQGKVLALMAQRLEYYYADQKSEEADRIDRERGLVRDINSTADGRYGNIGTGVNVFGSNLTPTSVDQVPDHK